jgi:hypothetical protein
MNGWKYGLCDAGLLQDDNKDLRLEYRKDSKEQYT